MNRSDALTTANKYISNDREEEYGSPNKNFTIAADLWNIYLLAKKAGTKLDAHDIAVMMCLLKIARIASGQPKDDNYVDGCGYLALASELVIKEP